MQFIEHPNLMPSNPGFRKLHPGFSKAALVVKSPCLYFYQFFVPRKFRSVHV